MLSVKNLYVVISRDISTDAVDQMNSIMKIIDRFGFSYNAKEMKKQGITLGEKPILFPAKYAVATSWYFGGALKKDTFLMFMVNIKDFNGESFGGPAQEHLIPAGIDRINMNFNVEGLPVSKAGKYTLEVIVQSKDGKKLAEGAYPFTVELAEEKDGNRTGKIKKQ